MSERKYSVSEIDRMRAAIRWSTQLDNRAISWEERAEDIERRLQTYMLNGTEPEEVEKAACEVRGWAQIPDYKVMTW